MSADEVTEPIEGEGYAVGSIDGIGEGYGFRKIRRELGVSAFGVNAVVMPSGYESGRHFHDEQEELYFVHRGTARVEVEGEVRELGPGGLFHCESTTPRKISNAGDEDLVIYIVGGKDGYVGRDGRTPEDEESPRGPGFSGPPGAAAS